MARLYPIKFIVGSCEPPSTALVLDTTNSSTMAALQPTQVTDFDLCEERPEEIDVILSGLDRYNPNTTVTLQDYVSNQCESKFVDPYANLALLKL